MSNSKAIFLSLLHRFRPSVKIMIEQPTSSWMPKQLSFRDVISWWGLEKQLVHQGFYGHDLLKPTHLWCNLCLQAVVTTATKERKAKHNDRIKRKNQRLLAAGKTVKEYYKKGPDGSYSGGKDLQSSAVYPQRFVTKVFSVWRQWFATQLSQFHRAWLNCQCLVWRAPCSHSQAVFFVVALQCHCSQIDPAVPASGTCQQTCLLLRNTVQ